VPAQVVTRLSAIDFGRGSEAFYRDQMPGLLTELANRARVQSITASSAIEGVVVADVGRAERIINRRTTTVRNRSEQELAGYRDAQDYLCQQDWRPAGPSSVKPLVVDGMRSRARPGLRRAKLAAGSWPVRSGSGGKTRQQAAGTSRGRLRRMCRTVQMNTA